MEKIFQGPVRQRWCWGVGPLTIMWKRLPNQMWHLPLTLDLVHLNKVFILYTYQAIFHLPLHVLFYYMNQEKTVRKENLVTFMLRIHWHNLEKLHIQRWWDSWTIFGVDSESTNNRANSKAWVSVVIMKICLEFTLDPILAWSVDYFRSVVV
jgi:hypothetical protein